MLDATGATKITSRTTIQSLWSGYGELVKLGLAGGLADSVVVKYIVLPSGSNHPRGWNTGRSHARKIKSYEVEMHWYRDWSSRCSDACRVARCYTATQLGDERVIVLEDLDAAGFGVRHSELDLAGVKQCLRWLAGFHSTFMGSNPGDLWQKGSYWHLETRPDEWAVMADGPLKEWAAAIDSKLNNCRYKTLVHGDAKVANFCFSADAGRAAAVDFQYVGGGCGMKDVVYLLGSCLSEAQCERWQNELLTYYFTELKQALAGSGLGRDELEREWRSLFAIAWTDFYRFLDGWMPSHHKINEYTRRLAVEAITELEAESLAEVEGVSKSALSP